MKLQILATDKYTVTAIVDERNGESCPLVDFLQELPAKYQGSVNGVINLIERIAQDGLDPLSSKQCHCVDSNYKIHELIKGDLRVFFFKGHCDMIVIATHGIIKKTQKTKASDKNMAVKYKQQYHAAHDDNKITLLKDPE